MAGRGRTRRLRSFLCIVPDALEALTNLEVLIIRLFMLGSTLYVLVRMAMTH